MNQANGMRGKRRTIGWHDDVVIVADQGTRAEFLAGDRAGLPAVVSHAVAYGSIARAGVSLRRGRCERRAGLFKRDLARLQES